MQFDPRVDTRLAWHLPLFTLGLTGGILAGRGASSMWPGAVMLALALGALIISRVRLRRGAWLLTAAALGCLLSYHAWHPAIPAEGPCTVEGVIAQEISLREDGQVSTILADVRIDGRRWPAKAYWSFYLDEGEPLPDALTPGARVAFTGRVYEPQARDNPGGFDFREYLLQRGVTFGVYGGDALTCPVGGFSLTGAMASLRHSLYLSLCQALGEESGAYAAAMLLGTRDFIPEEDNEAFRTLGIAHILSVSGYHVGVLTGLLAAVMRLVPMRRRTAAAIRAVILALYCLLTGGHAPVIRASLLVMLRDAGTLGRRRSISTHLLCASALIQLILSPPLLTSASFQLTYCAIAGLMLIQPWLLRQVHIVSPVPKYLWRSFSATLAAQIGILPAQLFWFGELPLMGLILNVPVLLLTSGLMTLYWLTLALLPIPGAAGFIGSAASAVTGPLLEGVRWLGSIESATLWTKQADLITVTGWLLAAMSMCMFLPRCLRSRRRQLFVTGALLLVVSLVPLPHDGTEYIQFSVGEADAAVLHDRNAVVVIDTGEDGQTLASWLHQRRLGVDLMILTHLHVDHAGGVGALLDSSIPVETLWISTEARTAGDADAEALALLDRLEAAGTQIVEVSRGHTAALPSGQITVLWPSPALVHPGIEANHTSLALLMEVKGTSLLLTGDLTSTYEACAAVPADLLKAAHHGSRSSTGTAFLQSVAPQAVILSCGDAEREQSLAGRTGSLPVYSTLSHGAVTIRFEDDRFAIETYLPKE